MTEEKMTCDKGCDFHRIGKCAWAPGLYRLAGYKDDRTHALHGELYRTVKEAEAGILKLAGRAQYEKYMAFKKDFYRRKREERRKAKQQEKTK